MRIKKVSQTTPVTAQVVDGYSTSTTDAYSANYINNKKWGADNLDSATYVTATMTSSYTTTTTSWETFPINDIIHSSGTKIYRDTSISTTGIVVGSGVKNVEVSIIAAITGGTTAGDIINIGIVRKRGSDYPIMTRAYKRVVNNWDSIVVPTCAFSVQEGDVILFQVRTETRSGAIFDYPYLRATVKAMF